MTQSSRTLAACAFALVTVVAGCSGEGDRQGERLGPLLLTEQTSAVARTEAGHLVTWAGVLRNPNPWHFGEHAVATVIGRDAAGREVVRAEQPLDAVPPGGTLPFTGEAVASGAPAQVQIHFRSTKWRRAARVPAAFLPFPVDDVVTERLKTGTYLVTGYVTDPYRKPVGSLTVTALLRDAAGRLVGGGTTFVDDVRPGTRRRFVITVDRVRQPVQRTDVRAGTWGATGRPYEELVLSGALPVHTVKPTTEPFATDRGGPLRTGDRRP